MWSTWLYAALLCGGIASAIAARRNLSRVHGFIWGAAFGIIGIIGVCAWPAGSPKAPDGMRSVKCRRCNTVQNVPLEKLRAACYQCKASIIIPPEKDGTRAVRCQDCNTLQYVQQGASRARCYACKASFAIPAEGGSNHA
jgi:ribosomal protein S27E